jgi:4-amino-4-deoxy-L-arabinose transferase-like glycosyltransferase
VIGGALPWSIALLERRRDQLFLWLWLAVPFVFFSLSQSKRPQYILPLMPAIALLAATRRRGLRWAGVAILIVGVALVIGVNVAHVHLKPAAMVGPAKIAAMAIGIVCVIGGTIAAVANRRAIAVCALSLPVLAIPLAANPLLVGVGEQRSTRTFIAQVAPYVTPQTEVVGIQAFTGSMPFYLHRTIVVVTPDAEELTSNYIVRHYAEFTRENVRPMSWLNAALADAKTPRVYIVRNNDTAHRALLESRGLRLIAVAPHHVAYTTPR